MDDVDGARIPEGLPEVVDAHVHLFPDRVFQAIERWFDQHGWPIRHRLTAQGVVDFLRDRGVKRVVGLSYAHKPGMARALNRFMADLVATNSGVIGLGTVLPGEEGAIEVLEEAMDLGLSGLKLHCHVQCFAPDSPEVGPIYDYCADRGLPLVMHAGREPKTAGLKCDPHALCSIDRVEGVLRDHPRLKLCIPHFGCADYDAYAELAERYENLWLDTTMVLGDYLPHGEAAVDAIRRLAGVRPDRIMYGTDFPILPYAWDREIVRLTRCGLKDDALAAVLGGNAERLYGWRGEGGMDPAITPSPTGTLAPRPPR